MWSYNGHFYTLTQDTGTWATAEAEAEALGGNLVTVDDGAEQQWLRQTFERFGEVWIGLTDQTTEGTWQWADGAAPAYTNWASGQPYQWGSDYDFACMGSGGQWFNTYTGDDFRGIIELTDLDPDGDKIPNALDAAPQDPLNSWELRGAGGDRLFDTSDDTVYQLTTANAYDGGTGVELFVDNGPLPNGLYRFTANSALTDAVGNRLDGNDDGTGGDAYQQFFEVALPAGPTLESGNNDTMFTATVLPMNYESAGAPEVQRITLQNVHAGNIFTLSFDNMTTAGIAVGATDSETAADIEAKINDPAVLGAGAVDVTVVSPNTYDVVFTDLDYHSQMSASFSTALPGGSVHQTQRLFLEDAPSGSSFAIAIDGKITQAVTLSQDPTANAACIEAALNNGDVLGAGAVTVRAAGNAAYDVVFNDNVSHAGMSYVNFIYPSWSVETVDGTQQITLFGTTPGVSTFRLQTQDGRTSGPILAGNGDAAVAANIQAALDDMLGAGVANVGVAAPNAFSISFVDPSNYTVLTIQFPSPVYGGVSSVGAIQQIKLTGVVPGHTRFYLNLGGAGTEFTVGADDAATAANIEAALNDEAMLGAGTVSVTVAAGNTFDVLFNGTGTYGQMYIYVSNNPYAYVLNQSGDKQITLSGACPGSVWILRADGMTYGSSLVIKESDADTVASIQAALDNMLGAGMAAVSEVPDTDYTYKVHFNDTGVAHSIEVWLRSPVGYVGFNDGVRQVKLANATPGETRFSLGIDGMGTNWIQVGEDDEATAANIRAALTGEEGMFSPETVSVSVAGPNTFDIAFSDGLPHRGMSISFYRKPGASVTSSVGSGATQQLRLANVTGGSTFALSIDGKNTFAIEVGVDDAATAANIEAALNAGNILGAGAVTVTSPQALRYNIQFNDTVGHALLQLTTPTYPASANTVGEARQIKFTNTVPGATFTLEIDGKTTAAITVGADDAATAANIAAALNAGEMLNGAAIVSVPGAGIFNITFSDGSAAHGQLGIRFPGLPTGKVVAGGSRQITFGNVVPGSTVFNLRIDNIFTADITVGADDQATAASIQAALNDANVLGGGAATVEVSSAGSFRVTFNDGKKHTGINVAFPNAVAATLTNQSAAGGSQCLSLYNVDNGFALALRLDGKTTAPITVTADSEALRASIETALDAILGEGAVSVTLGEGYVEVKFNDALPHNLIQYVFAPAPTCSVGTIGGTRQLVLGEFTVTDTFSIRIDGKTTSAIAGGENDAQTASNIQTALNAALGAGTVSVSVAPENEDIPATAFDIAFNDSSPHSEMNVTVSPASNPNSTVSAIGGAQQWKLSEALPGTVYNFWTDDHEGSFAVGQDDLSTAANIENALYDSGLGNFYVSVVDASTFEIYFYDAGNHGLLYAYSDAAGYMESIGCIQQVRLADGSAAGSTFRLQIDGNTTEDISVAADNAVTAANMEAALNSQTMLGPSAVKVTAGADGSYNVIFDGIGTHSALQVIADDGGGTVTTVGGVQQVELPVQPAGSGYTIWLDQNWCSFSTGESDEATAARMQDALNGSSMLGAGAVTVTVTSANTFDIAFNGLGAHTPLWFDAATGTSATAETASGVQEIYVAVQPLAVFALNVDGKTTGAIPCSEDPAVTAANIEAALNDEGVLGAGAVSVAAGPGYNEALRFYIIFNDAGKHDLISFTHPDAAVSTVGGVQRLYLEEDEPGAFFSLWLDGKTSSPIEIGENGTATAEHIEEALNAENMLGASSVSVSFALDNRYNVVFNNLDPHGTLGVIPNTAGGFVNLTGQVQQIGFSNAPQGSYFALHVDNLTTSRITIGENDTATAANIASALNALLGAGSVSVASRTDVPDTFVVTFNGSARSQMSIDYFSLPGQPSASFAGTGAVQRLELANVLPGQEFTLALGEKTTPVISAGTDDNATAATIQAALNNTGVLGAGAVSVVALGANTYEITFLDGQPHSPFSVSVAQPAGIVNELNCYFLGSGLGRQDPADSYDEWSDPDYWKFEALAGDIVSISVDTPDSSVDTYVELHNSADNYIAADSGSGPDGDAFISHYVIQESGTYYIKVGKYYYSSPPGDYELHVALTRGIQQETDGSYGNDSLSGANRLEFTVSGNQRSTTVAGTIMAAEGSNQDSDYFALGTLNAGNQVELTLRLPAESSLNGMLTVVDANGNAVTDTDGNPLDGHFLGTMSADGAYYARVDSLWGYNGHQYLVTDSNMTWTQAEAYAQALGGHLVTINDAAEQEWLRANMGQFGSLWIGYTDQDEEGAWKWSSGDASQYTAWENGEPDASGSADYAYAYFGSADGWRDAAGNNSMRALIEFNSPGADSSAGPDARYLLDVNIGDSVPPRVTGVDGLPADGSATDGVVQAFTVNLNESLDPADANAGDRMVWSYNGHYYVLTGDSETWSAAEAEAQALGGHLVTVNDAAEQQWLRQTFERFGNAWIGFTDQVSEGTWLWADGSTAGYTAWASGEPYSSSYNNSYDFAYMGAGGQWYDSTSGYSRPGIIELAGPDADADLLPDVLDPAPNDPLNSWDLREAGADELFDTPDDVIYRLTLTAPYTGGTSAGFFIEEGPLPGGHYRFTANSALTDIVGNVLDGNGDGVGGDTYQRVFDVAPPDGYTVESGNNDTPFTATELPLTEDPAGSGLLIGRGLGRQDPADYNDSSWSDPDYWKIEALAGDIVSISVDTPDSSFETYVELHNSVDSQVAADDDSGPDHDAFISRYVIQESGTYYIKVGNGYYGSSSGDYELHVELARGIQQEADANYGNNAVSGANTVSWTAEGTHQTATIAGSLMAAGDSKVDGDYFSLGNIQPGQTILLSLRLPGSSSLDPVLEVRDSNNNLVSISANPSDAVARVDVSSAGSYYAVVRATSGSGSRGQYLLDAAIWSTGELEYADLGLTGVVNPGTASSGETAHLSWTVQNFGSGSTTVSKWYDRVVLSTNDRYGDSDDIFVTSLQHEGVLAPGGAYTAETDVQLPLGISGDFWVLVKSDQNNSVFEYLFEENNVGRSASQISVGLTPSADLEAGGVSIPALVIAEDPITVSWTVENPGPGITGLGTPGSVVDSWTDRIVLSPNGLFGDADDLILANVPHVGALGPGESYDGTFTGTIAGLSGTYHVFVYTDAGDKVYEQSNAHSNLAQSAGTLAVAPRAFSDLDIAEVTAPYTVPLGQEVLVQWTGVNTEEAYGATPTSWWDRVILSQDETYGNSDDRRLGDFQHEGAVNPGENYSGSGYISIPTDVSGPCWLFVKSDIYNQVYEFTLENNNVSSPKAIMVPGPDLEVDSVTTPSEAQFGQTIDVSFTVRNTGEIAANTNWTDFIWLSADSVLDDNDVLLKTVPVGISSPLAAGSCYTVTVPTLIPLDADLSDGNHHILVQADGWRAQPEVDDSDNLGVGGQLTLTYPPLPDLVVSEISAPVEAVSGQEIVLAWTLANQGEDKASGTWTDRIYLSTDALGGGKRYFGDFTFTGEIDAGDSISRMQTVGLPVDLQGRFWVTVETDFRNQIVERANESNNITVDDTPIDVQLAPMPNLQVSAVTPPSGAFSSQQTVVEWTVTNTGTGATSTPVWYDAVYLSVDQIEDDTDILLGSLANASYLGAGESYANSMTVTLPKGIDSSYYFLVKTDCFNDVYEAGAENDNLNSGGPVRIQLTPPPDLQVSSVQAPSQAFSGQPVTVDWQVTNAGEGRTIEDGWCDTLYLSADQTLDSSDAVMTIVNHDGAVNPGDSYSGTSTFSLPAGVSGDFYFFVRTDFYNNVYEHNTEGNNTGLDATAVHVTLTPPPDLEVEQLTVPDNAVAGHPLTISYRVTNFGATETPENTWVDSFYLSADDQLDRDDLYLGDQRHWGILDPGDSYESAATFTLSNELVGSYYAFVVTDGGDAVFELDNDNNTAAPSGPVTIEYRPADLVIDSMTAPGSAKAGDQIRVTWTVRNQGTGDTDVSEWRDGVFVSEDGALDLNTDLRIACIGHTGVLKPGESYTRSELIELPMTLEGQYQIIVITDGKKAVYEGSLEDNNVSAASPIDITRETPDLQAKNVNTSESATAGDSIQVSWQVQNLGSRYTNANYWYDSVYLSRDQVISQEDVLLGSVHHTNRLQAGETYDVTSNFALPADLVGTDYYVLVRTDSSNLVLEDPFEQNNDGRSEIIQVTGSEALTHDLRLVGVDAPADALSGQPFSLTWTVQNDGDSTGDRKWYDTIYLSRDQVFDPLTDQYLGYQYHTGGLAKGESYTATSEFNVPAGLSGPFYVFVSTDWGNYISEETNKLNNSGFDPGSVKVALAPPADLVVGEIDIPANAVPGQNALIGYSILNQGEETAVGSWYDSIYISADDTWDLGDALFGRVLHSGDVLAGSSYSGSLEAPLPGVTPGQYHVIIRSDILNHVRESNEHNNIGATLDKVVIDARELQLGVAATGTLAQGQAAYYRITASAGETLRLKLDSASETASTELYVRYGEMPTRGQFDFAGSVPFTSDQEVIMPVEQDGTYYVLVYGAEASAAANYSLTAETVPFSLRSVEAGVIGNEGQAALEIYGARFTSDTLFKLVSSTGEEIGAEKVVLNDSTLAYVTFNLADRPVGVYDLVATQAGAIDALLPDSVTVQEAVGRKILISLNGPSSVRQNRNYIFDMTYSNIGDTDTMAPLLLVQSTTSTPAGLTLGTIGSSETVQVLGVSLDGPAETLRPGDSSTVPVFFSSTTNPVNFNVRTLAADNRDPIEFDLVKESIRIPGLSDAEWESFWTQIKPRLGATWGDYVQIINAMSREYSSPGKPIYDVKALFTKAYEDNRDFLPTSTISGQLLDSQTGAPIASLEIGAYLTRQDGTFIAGDIVTTDDQGRFTLTGLLPGTYMLSLGENGFDMDRDGYTDVSPPSYDVDHSADIGDLLLYSATSSQAVSTNDSEPVVAVDSEGTLNMIWNHDGTVWHAYLDGAQWAGAVQISDAAGSNLSLVAGDNILDGTDAGLLAVWEQGTGNAAEIYFAVGRATAEGGYEWSAPVQLTNDNVRDSNPEVVVADSGQILITYLKANDEIQDDTDVYYNLLAIDSSNLTWPESSLSKLAVGKAEALGLDGSISASYSYSHEIKLGGFLGLPKIDAELGFEGSLELSGCSLSASAQGNVSVDLGKWEIEGHGAIGAEWEVNKKTCAWEFEKATADLGASGTFDWDGGLTAVLNAVGPFVGIPGLGTVAEGVITVIEAISPLEIDNGISFGLGLDFEGLQWTSQAPFPDFFMPEVIGKTSLSGEIKPYLKGSVGNLKAEIVGTLAVSADILPAFGNLEVSGELKIVAQLGWFSRTWVILEGSTAAAKAVLSDVSLTGKDELPGEMIFSYNPEGAIGTGNVYGTGAMLSNVAEDVLNDGAASPVRDADGNVFSAWLKDADPYGDQMGNYVEVADFDGTGWSVPVTVPGSLGLNRDVQATVDSQGRRLLVWSMADSSSLDSSTTWDELQAARSNTDVVYSVFSNGVWSTPQSVAATPGLDGSVALGTAPDGQVVLTWLQKSEDGLYHLVSSKWDGNAWAPVREIAAADAIGSPQISLAGGKTTVFWTQDTNSDPDVTEKGLFCSTFDNGWSAPVEFNPLDTALLVTGQKDGTAKGFSLDGPESEQLLARGIFSLPLVPEDCCDQECEPGDPACDGGGDNHNDDDDVNDDTQDPTGTPSDPGEPGREGQPDGDDISPQVVIPRDPNDIVGPSGFGDENWITGKQPLAYKINFENAADASAPAQQVVITQQLDPDLDFNSFRVDDFGWGGLIFELPADKPFYQATLDLTSTLGFYVDVAAAIDVTTGLATWTLTTVDPSTGELPENALTGFLPVNDDTGRGEGFVSYTIKPKRDAETGDVIDAKAQIIFDTEEPIDTPPIFNTLDTVAPTSAVAALPATAESTEFLVSWAGSDDATGSAIAGYSIYVSVNGGDYSPWLTATTREDAIFTGSIGSTYAFYSVARDNAGNEEAAPETPDSFISFRTDHAPVNTVPGPQSMDEDSVLVFSDENSNTISISDPQAGDSPLQVILSVTDGTLTLGKTDGISFKEGDGTSDASMTIVGLLPDINEALRGLSFTSSPNWHGAVTFTISSILEENAGSEDPQGDTDTVTITVAPVADAPAAANDSYAVDEDVILTAAVPGVMANDADVDGDTLTAALVGGPAHGMLVFNSDGSFSYDPDDNYFGPDGFTYRLSDGIFDSNVAKVDLTVNPVNDAPEAVDDGYTTDKGTPIAVAASDGVLANDSDVDRDALTATLVEGPQHGILALNADGSFTYTPSASVIGKDSFTYQAWDANGGKSDTATVTITINTPPVAGNNTYSIAEDNVLNIAPAGVLADDADSEHDALTAELVDGPGHGQLIFNEDGSFVYTPTENYNGTDSFTYRASDGRLHSNLATVAITVTPVNDPPASGNDTYTAKEDTKLTVSAATGVLKNDSDPEKSKLSAVLVDGPLHGALAFKSDGSFAYTPGANFDGTDSFTYKASDGAAEGEVTTVTINITAANDAPVAGNDGYTTDEDSELIVNAVAGVLANDSDVDGDTLTATVVSRPKNGTLSLNADGSFTYTPDSNYNGADSFTYKVSDGSISKTATAVFNITPVNDPPASANDTYTTKEDTKLVVSASKGVLKNDSDPEKSELSATLVDGPLHGTLAFKSDGSFTYTPEANFNGTDSFTYTASDGSIVGEAATVTLNVTAVNDAPVAGNDSYTTAEDSELIVDAVAGVLANDSDVDGSALIATVVSRPKNGTLSLNADGSFRYTPKSNYCGADSFTYKVSDGSSSKTATVVLNVAPVNDAPVSANDAYATKEDTRLVVSASKGVLKNDVDVEKTRLTAILVEGPEHGVLALHADGSFTFTPEANYNGTDSFTYMASDGAATGNTATVTLNVTAVNDAPAAANDVYDDLAGNTVYTKTAPGVLANDGDIESATLTATVVSGPKRGKLTLSKDGSFSYTPGATFSGSDSFTYKVSDGKLSSNVATVTLNAAVAGASLGGNGAAAVLPDPAYRSSDIGSLTLSDAASGATVYGNLREDTGNGLMYSGAEDFMVYDELAGLLSPRRGSDAPVFPGGASVNLNLLDSETLAFLSLKGSSESDSLVFDEVSGQLVISRNNVKSSS
ncbi:MAG: tandem-95 repeat protein [Desulfobacteraceae bacterium]|nr:tandem-95 repeat protein [Desulfobacteraceae bacterium]